MWDKEATLFEAQNINVYSEQTGNVTGLFLPFNISFKLSIFQYFQLSNFQAAKDEKFWEKTANLFFATKLERTKKKIWMRKRGKKKKRNDGISPFWTFFRARWCGEKQGFSGGGFRFGSCFPLEERISASGSGVLFPQALTFVVRVRAGWPRSPNRKWEMPLGLGGFFDVKYLLHFAKK